MFLVFKFLMLQFIHDSKVFNQLQILAIRPLIHHYCYSLSAHCFTIAFINTLLTHNLYFHILSCFFNLSLILLTLPPPLLDQWWPSILTQKHPLEYSILLLPLTDCFPLDDLVLKIHHIVSIYCIFDMHLCSPLDSLLLVMYYDSLMLINLWSYIYSYVYI